VAPPVGSTTPALKLEYLSRFDLEALFVLKLSEEVGVSVETARSIAADVDTPWLVEFLQSAGMWIGSMPLDRHALDRARRPRYSAPPG
jgi:hypothetical protein